MNGGLGISYEIALRWMLLDLTDDKSTLVQVMAWCRQATSHYLSRYWCWPRSMSPNGITGPQWISWLFCTNPSQWQEKTLIICRHNIGWQQNIAIQNKFLWIQELEQFMKKRYNSSANKTEFSLFSNTGHPSNSPGNAESWHSGVNPLCAR